MRSCSFLSGYKRCKTKFEGEIKSLENLREQTQSRGEQLAATQQIYERQLQIIELEYNSTIAAIDANRTKLQIQESILESKIAEAEVAAAIAELEGKKVDSAVKAVNSAKEQLASTREINQIINQDLDVQRDIAGEIKNQATAAAKLARDTDTAAIKAGTFASNAGSGATNTSNAASSAGTLATSMGNAATAAGNFASAMASAAQSASTIHTSMLNGVPETSLGLGKSFVGPGGGTSSKVFEGFAKGEAMQYALSKNKYLGEEIIHPKTGEKIYQRRSLGGEIFTRSEGQRQSDQDVLEYFEKAKKGFNFVNGEWVDNSFATKQAQEQEQAKIQAEIQEAKAKDLEEERKLAEQKAKDAENQEQSSARMLGYAKDSTAEAHKQAALLKQLAVVKRKMGEDDSALMQEAHRLLTDQSATLRFNSKQISLDIAKSMQMYANLKRLSSDGNAGNIRDARHAYRTQPVKPGNRLAVLANQ